MLESPYFESFAHYMSGMTTVTFGIWAVMLYQWRKRNRMTFLLFLTVAFIALSFLKDTIFLLPPQVFSDFYFVENMVSIFDICFVPLACSFFIEATRPGIMTNRRLLLSFLLFFALLPLYCLTHAKWVLIASFALSLLATLLTCVLVPINVVRYSRYLSDNYSFIKGISVKWCMVCTFGFFLWLLFYQICFYEPTWFGEMIYDAGFLIIWNVICLKNRNHDVVTGMMSFEECANRKEQTAAAEPQYGEDTGLNSAAEPEQPEDEETNKQISAESQPKIKEAFIAEALLRCMETDRLYLNPRLSLADLALAAGTNKTYISTYINSLGKTFYDYVNEYRVAEACRIIDERTKGERLSMADVATQSGFNSISTFNRYFSKLKGITPTSYSRR